MAYTLALDVNIGDYTKASNYDTLSDNADYLQVLADVDHDFHVSTGTGKHKLIQFLADSAYDVGTSTVRARVTYTDTLGDSGQQLAIASSSVRTALQPCFLALPSGTLTDVTGDGTAYTVLWATEVKDQGGNFASPTFTAPVTGTYLLGASVGLSGILSTHTSAVLTLVTSNRNYRGPGINPYAVMPVGEELVLEVVRMVDMDAGDTASVTLAISNGTKVVDIVTSSESYFFGAMIN